MSLDAWTLVQRKCELNNTWTIFAKRNSMNEIALRRSQTVFAILMSLAAMCVGQLGAALSAETMDAYGTFPTTWGRVSWAGLILAIVVRPRIRTYSRTQWIAAVALGAAISVLTICFYEALTRVPLGLVASIAFLGPLSVAMLQFCRSWRLLWPLVAFAGVLLLVRKPAGWSADVFGLGLAIGAGVGWGGYVVLMKRIGSLFPGLEGLTISFVTAAFFIAPFALAQTGTHIPGGLLIQTAGLAVMTSLLPYALDMMALRRLPSGTFGVLASAEPAIGALAGFFVLHQPLSFQQTSGIALVAFASIGVVKSTNR
jgi:inner membrane transporter RhtA